MLGDRSFRISISKAARKEAATGSCFVIVLSLYRVLAAGEEGAIKSVIYNCSFLARSLKTARKLRLGFAL